jgi:hypothetical protein
VTRTPLWLTPLWLTALLAGMLVLAACGATAEPSAASAPASDAAQRGACSLGVTGSAEEQIAALLRAEGELVAAQQIDALMALWADGGEVVDAKHSPDDPSDDQRWMGLDAVRHRYVRIVFPGNPAPPPLESPDPPPTVTIDGDRAEVRSTTRIGGEVAPAGDRWNFVRHGDCWSIAALTYNLEPAP